MMMKRNILLTTALVAAGLSMPAFGQSFNDQALAGLRGDGWTPVELKSGPSQTKVEAVRGDTKLEVVWDRNTGEILKQETERFFGTDADDQVIEIDTRARDFVDDDRDSDDDDDHDDDDRDDDDRDEDRDNDDREDDERNDDDHDNDDRDDHDDRDNDRDDDRGGDRGDDGDSDDGGRGGGDDGDGDGDNSGPGGGDDSGGDDD